MSEQQQQINLLVKQMKFEDQNETEGKGPKCYYCKQFGHEMENCPKIKAKEERAAREKAEADAAKK